MEDLKKAIYKERRYNKKIRKRNGELDEKLEGALGEVENCDIHDIDLEILRMKYVL